MCSIILAMGPDGVFIAANRDEMIARPSAPPAAHWPEFPGIIAGRDLTAGGTWLGINRHDVVVAVLNRQGTLGPRPGKRSRGELPLLALTETNAAKAAAKIAALDAGFYRSFNLVAADRDGAYFCAGLEGGTPHLQPLEPGITMITSGAPNDAQSPRIARYLPQFRQADRTQWPSLLADAAPPANSALNIKPAEGFGTVSASIIELPKTGRLSWRFADGAPDQVAFSLVVR